MIIFILIISIFLNFYGCSKLEPSKVSPVIEKYPEAEKWRRDGSYILSPYGKIFTKDLGEGENILLLHGYPSNSYDYFPLSLGLKNRLLFIDLLGFGYSDKPRNINYTYKIQTDIVENYLQQKKINELFIVAHDYGVTIAQELLARSIDNNNTHSNYFKIKGIIIISGGLFPEYHKSSISEQITKSSLGEYFDKWIGKDRYLKNLLELYNINKRPSSYELEELWKIINYQEGSKLSHKLIYFHKDREYNYKRYITPLNNKFIPTIVIEGADDPNLDYAEIDKYQEITDKEKIFILDNTGHFPHIESYKEVINIINNFIISIVKNQ